LGVRGNGAGRGFAALSIQSENGHIGVSLLDTVVSEIDWNRCPESPEYAHKTTFSLIAIVLQEINKYFYD
jgi:hypothetical protein